MMKRLQRLQITSIKTVGSAVVLSDYRNSLCGKKSMLTTLTLMIVLEEAQQMLQDVELNNFILIRG